MLLAKFMRKDCVSRWAGERLFQVGGGGGWGGEGGACFKGARGGTLKHWGLLGLEFQHMT